jgi:hypothetical protein
MLYSNKKQLNLLLMLLLLTQVSLAQVVTTDPVFVKENDSVVIFFHADKGSGGLSNYMGEVYAHTGVITNNSTSNSDWKYVKTNWGQNTPENQTHSLEFKSI